MSTITIITPFDSTKRHQRNFQKTSILTNVTKLSNFDKIQLIDSKIGRLYKNVKQELRFMSLKYSRLYKNVKFFKVFLLQCHGFGSDASWVFR